MIFDSEEKIGMELVEHESARSVVYKRLACAFRPPTGDLGEGLRELEAVLAYLGSDAREEAAKMRDSFENAGPTTLNVEHARLFIGPFLVLAPPYGSVYLENEHCMMGNSTIEAQGHYRSIGLDIADSFKEAPDHISAELEFMHALTFQATKAIQAGDSDFLSDRLRRQQVFLSVHLGRWISAFTTKIKTHAVSRFYISLAETACLFVGEEMEVLAGLRFSEEGGGV